jgi:phage/plasmid-associated DNA primase
MEYEEGKVHPFVSSKFFDMDFTGSIETPLLDSILDYQQWSSEVKEAFYALMGRLLYRIGSVGENWQIVPFLVGEAGTGKSTICNIVREFYDTSKVGMITNNHQSIFGLEPLLDKDLVIGSEIGRNWSLEQTEFKTMVSADIMTINLKHQKSGEDIRWDKPMLLSGNEFPNFSDNSDALARRFVPFRFNIPIDNNKIDSQLEDKIKQEELPNIIHRCNAKYLEWVREKGHRGIWDILPPFFMKMRKEISLTTNPLVNFLETGEVEFGEDYEIAMTTFHKMLNQHLKLNNFGNFKLVESVYTSTFRKYNLSVYVAVDKGIKIKKIKGVRMMIDMPTCDF